MPGFMKTHPDTGHSVHENETQAGINLLHSLASRRAVRTPLNWPIGVLVFMVLVSLWATFDIRFSLPKIIGLLLGVAVFYATVGYAANTERLLQTVALFFSIGTGIAGLGLVGTNWLYKNPLLSQIVGRLPQWIRGLPGAPGGFHPNEVAGVLLWFVPAQIALLIWLWRRGHVRGRNGTALVVSTFLTTVTLVLTQSRSGWLGLAAGLAMMGACEDRRMRVGLALFAVVALAIVGVRGPSWVGTVLFGDAASEVVGTLNWGFRVQVWRAALWGIHDFPFTGMGLGTFRRVARVLYPLAVPPMYDIAHAHNGFLQAGLDFGVPGLVAYSALWLLAAWLVVSALRQLASRPQAGCRHEVTETFDSSGLRALAVGLGGSLVGSLAYNLTDTVALGAKPGLAWWMMLGLIVSAYRLAVSCQVGEQ